MEKTFFKGKKVLVMGLGNFGGGLDSAIFAAKAGAHVTVTDLAKEESLSGPLDELADFDVEFHLGAHHQADFAAADIIIVNPAVPPQNSFLQIARQAHRLITSQIEIFFQLCPATIVGITGANGKSTTTALTAHLLQAASSHGMIKDVHLAGNIGNRPLLSRIDRIAPDHVVVLELSSFQLEQLANVRKAPHISVITNLTPNHLDRHGTFDAYCQAKENIFKYQTLDRTNPAVSIFNREDPITLQWHKRYSPQPGRSCFTFGSDDIAQPLIDAFKLPGRANLSNLAAARTVAACFRMSDDLIKQALPTFEPLPHRLELVARIDGVSWYNDSIATTPPSAIAALDAFSQPKIIIAGGYDKKLPFDEFGQQIAKKAKAAILLGATAQKIAETVRNAPDSHPGLILEFADSMPDAVDRARKIAINGDVVLLSPACASYDMFDNYRHRGDTFAECVRRFRR